MKKLGKPDKLDVYRSCLIDGVELKPAQVEMLAKYCKAHGLLCLGFSRNQVLATLEKELELSQPQLYAIIRECIALYGDIEEVGTIVYSLWQHRHTASCFLVRLKGVGIFRARFEDEEPIGAEALDPVATVYSIPLAA